MTSTEPDFILSAEKIGVVIALGKAPMVREMPEVLNIYLFLT